MIEVKPMTNTFVADITGVDVRHLSDEAFEQLYAAWLRIWCSETAQPAHR